MTPSSNSASVSSTLLDQLHAGRPEAWERLVRLYGPVVHRWCRRSGLNADDAADVLQEVLSAVVLHLPDFHRDGPQDSFSGWLAAITRNKVRDHYRRRHGRAEARGGSTAVRRLSEIPQPPQPGGQTFLSGKGEPGGQTFLSGKGEPGGQTFLSGSSAEESIQPDADSQAFLSRRVLETIRAEFEPRTWDAFWRTTVDGQPPANVAQDLQMSVPAVYMAKSRVLRRLRRAMSELPP
jgi:RNA polymerase sigma-70 factor, ECF subfamily